MDDSIRPTLPYISPLFCAGILEQSVGASIQVGIVLSMECSKIPAQLIEQPDPSWNQLKTAATSTSKMHNSRNLDIPPPPPPASAPADACEVSLLPSPGKLPAPFVYGIYRGLLYFTRLQDYKICTFIFEHRINGLNKMFYFFRSFNSKIA